MGEICLNKTPLSPSYLLSSLGVLDDVADGVGSVDNGSLLGGCVKLAAMLAKNYI